MTRNEYQKQLDDLQNDVVGMSEEVADRLDTALTVLDDRNPELADTVIEGDDEINDLYLELEKDCIDLLALQQPVATDLRFVTASFKIITDVERVGDLATNLAEYSLDAGKDAISEAEMQDLGRKALDMFRRSVESYEKRDTELCYSVADEDTSLDEDCERINQDILKRVLEAERSDHDPGEIDDLIMEVSRLLLTIRDIERIGDHSVNIAARTLYMVESDDELIW
ncbi:MAG: phosphate signaling complex protein PhoU [Halobacteria archaeon]